MLNNRPSFLLYKSFYAPVKHLKDDELGLLFRALFDYQNGLEIIDLPPQVGMAFAFFKNQFDLDEQKYQVVLERNKSNGSKGGRPKKEETQANPENPVGFYEPRKGEKENGIDKEKGKDINKKPKGFIAPTLEDVKNYCQERSNSVNPQKFFDYYSAGNWKDAKGNSVKNWKQKLLTWESKDPSPTQKDSLAAKLNSIAGGDYFKSITLGDKAIITCNIGMKSKVYSLPEEIRQKIKDEFKQPIEIN